MTSSNNSRGWRGLLLSLFSHRFLALARWELYFLILRARNVVTWQGLRIRRSISVRARPLYLNLGAGPRGIDDAHWVNVDGFRSPHIHFLLDLSRRLPFPDECFEGVFCEHVLEHFSIAEGEALACEIRRVLKCGGCLRVVVPDARLLLRRYFDTPSEIVAARGTSGTETPMEAVNSYFRQRYEHQFLYDTETLATLLTRAGFSNAVAVEFGRSQTCPPIVLDDSKYEWESLYLEAVK